MILVSLFANKNHASIWLLSPNGGEIYVKDSTIYFSWIAGDSSVKLNFYLWKASSCAWSLILQDIPSYPQSYNLTIPFSMLGNMLRLKIIPSDSSGIIYSCGYFSVIPNSQGSSPVCDLSFESDISISPNPVDNTFKIISSLPIYSVSIFDILGNKQILLFNQDLFDCNVLSSGEYFVKIQLKDRVVVKSFIKR